MTARRVAGLPPAFCLSQLHGKLRVILEPLIGTLPLVGAVTMFFIRKPVSAAAVHVSLPVRRARLLCALTILCFPEAGHQLDRTD